MGLSSFDVSMILIMVLYLLGFLKLASAAVPNYRVHDCTNDTTYTPNSTYQVNLKHMLSSLSSNATREGGFYNATAGQTPDTSTYGLFLCRGDLSTDVCRDCVAFAASEIVRVFCPVEKVAIIWYDECILRYSDRSIFSTMQERPGYFMWNTRNATQPSQFRLLVLSTLYDLVSSAANATSGAKKFAVKEVANASGLEELQTLYSLAQCTPDINSSDCSTCLRNAIFTSFPRCDPCQDKQGGRILGPSCNLRFEIYPFYLIAAHAPTPIPVLLPPAPGKDKISMRTIVIIVASIALSLVIISVSYCFLRRRARN